MTAYKIHWHTLLVCLCILGLAPNSSQAVKGDEQEQYKKSKREFLPGERSPNYPQKGDQSKKRDQINRDKSRKDRDRHEPPRRRSEQHPPERRDRSDRDHRTRTKPKQRSRRSHDRHYERYSRHHRRHPHHRHETYRYHTHYIAPIHHHYHPIGFRLWYLPPAHLRIVVHGLPYFYFSGVFYRYHTSGYVVVRAPIGAVVNVLPAGFIAFSLGGLTYYYINDTYYLWDDNYEAYVVVEKPIGADGAITDTTKGRLFVYPNHGQSEELQAKDRYECHRWAVHQTHVDPSLDDEDELSRREKDNYKRAISACLEGRGYTVK